jgi:WD40 repeat protein
MNITEHTNNNNREQLYDAPVLQFDDNRASTGLEKEKAVKAIKFEQRAILNIDSAEHLTSHVMFHPFLDILAVSDGKSVGIWNLNNGSRIMQIKRPCDPNYLLNPDNKNIFGAKERKKKERTGSFSLLGGGGSTTNLGTPSSSAKLASELGGSNVTSPDKVEASDTRITAMTWINESFDALLALGADNGTVSIWRDTSTSKTAPQSGASSIRVGEKEAKAMASNESTSLASAFVALPDIAETTRGSGTVFSWQQHSGTMVVGGNSSTIRLWDLGREQCVRVFPTGLETCTTTLASKTVAPLGTSPVATSNPHALGDEYNLSWTFAGFADGSIAVFDERVQGTGRVASAREHSAWIVAAHFRPDVPEVITGSVRGSVKFWDLRTMRSFKTLEVHKSPLTALAVHPCAPIMATGSHAQFIKILTLGGEQLGGIIKYHDGFLGQRIGPVSCLAFHPTKVLLAAGATDSIVSIYGEKRSE